MSLQFIIGSSGIGKTHYACQRIIQESLENPGKLYYIIVPEQFTMQTEDAGGNASGKRNPEY